MLQVREQYGVLRRVTVQFQPRRRQISQLLFVERCGDTRLCRHHVHDDVVRSLVKCTKAHLHVWYTDSILNVTTSLF